jgi:hypothetical protein
LVAAAVVLSAAFVPLGVSQAVASSGPDSAEQGFIASVGAAAIANQDALSQYRAWMIGQPGFASSGYVGSIDDLQHKATAILWSGPQTALLSAILDEGAKRGITVSVRQRSHSLAQLNAAEQAIWQQSATGEWAGLAVSSIAAVGATDDGLTVYGTYTQTPAAQRGAAVKAQATTVSGVPVHVVANTPAVLTNGRDNDFAPFDAGGLMGYNGTICSSGFSIRLGGVTRTTTARHCDAPSYTAVDDASSYYGTGLVNSGDGGARVLTGSGAPLALDGPWNSNNYKKTVIGFEDLGIGDWVCTGGGNSGEHCGVQIVNLSVSWSDGKGTFSAIEGVEETGADIAEIQGDSGGPVISLTGTNGAQVRAAGMIQGFIGSGRIGAVCGPVHFAGNNQCSGNVVFSSMRTVANSLGASLLTG